MTLNEETIKNLLKNSGLTVNEADVYILLAKHDPLKCLEVAKLLRKDKAQVFRILKSLQTKGYVESTLEFPTRFSVVPFETILESIVKTKREEVSLIEKSKKELLEYVKKRQTLSETTFEKFIVVEGDKKIYSKISSMIADSKRQLSTIATVPILLRADQLGVLDIALSHPMKSQVEFRFLTELSNHNLNPFKRLMKKIPTATFNFKARNPDLSLTLFPIITIKDNQEILFFTTPQSGKIEKDDVCLWTNCKSLVQAFTAVFEDLWQNSMNIQEKIAEIKKGKLTKKSCVFLDKEFAKKKYDEIVQSAKNEIISMTSSAGVIRYWKNISRLKKWADKGISIRIMAPIIGENFEAADHLSKICTIKHVPASYFESTIIDGKHFFQFKPPPQNLENPMSIFYFENTFYTNDSEYVEKMKNTLDDLWKNARKPSIVTLESALKKSREPIAPPSYYRSPCYLGKTSGFQIKNWKQKEMATEKDILEKIIDLKQFHLKTEPTSPLRLYGSMASAAIHPPDYFNMPDIAISVFHVEKQSSFGEEDCMLVYMWLETPKGQAYVPVAYVGDNPKAQNFWKVLMASNPAGQNIQLVKKDELQVRIHGTTLFAGWTMQMPLLPPKHTLPPACLLIEGYGDLKTDSYNMHWPSGNRTDVERNSCEAFVTFFHPKSKYSGPGTDGFFARDYIATTYPPSANEE